MNVNINCNECTATKWADAYECVKCKGNCYECKYCKNCFNIECCEECKQCKECLCCTKCSNCENCMNCNNCYGLCDEHELDDIIRINNIYYKILDKTFNVSKANKKQLMNVDKEIYTINNNKCCEECENCNNCLNCNECKNCNNCFGLYKEKNLTNIICLKCDNYYEILDLSFNMLSIYKMKNGWEEFLEKLDKKIIIIIVHVITVKIVRIVIIVKIVLVVKIHTAVIIVILVIVV